MSTCLFISSPYREESNSMQGASVKQTRSVCSERARTPTGGRSRCGFAKRTRGFSAQSPSPKQMCCRRHFCWLCPRRQIPFIRGESNSVQGAGVKKTLRQRMVGRAFPMTVQAEGASRNPASNWDTLSASPAASKKPVRPPSQNWVEEGQNATAGGQHDCRR